MQDILEARPEADIRVQLVWSAIFPADDRARALAQAQAFADARVQHYWDPEELIGLFLAPGLPLGEAPFAWDVYLIYDREARWSGTPPRPAAWAHQLAGADADRFFGGRIREKLAEDLERLLAPR